MATTDAHAGSASIVVAPTDWLHLAATPTFAAMALLTGTVGAGSMNIPCPATHEMSPLGGMTVMYVLMAAFHAVPWLKLGSRLCRGLRPSRSQR